MASNSIILNRTDRKLIESITELNGVIFLHLKNYDDCVICKDKNEVYIALNQFRTVGKVNTDENAELLY